MNGDRWPSQFKKKQKKYLFKIGALTVFACWLFQFGWLKKQGLNALLPSNISLLFSFFFHFPHIATVELPLHAQKWLSKITILISNYIIKLN